VFAHVARLDTIGVIISI